MGLFSRKKNLNNQKIKENYEIILNIKREKDIEAALVPMEIYINNNKITKLKNGQNYTTRVTYGEISLKIKMWGMTDNKTINISKDCKSICVKVGLDVGLVTKKPKIKFVTEDNNVLIENNDKYIEKNSISNKMIIDDIPEILITDNNKENEKTYFDTYNWFKNNRNSIINKLKETYIEYENLDKDFVIFCIEGMNKQEIISEDKFGDNQILYSCTQLDEFVDRYDENSTFLKIQCGAKDDDDTFSFAFINCNTKETTYFFHRF